MATFTELLTSFDADAGKRGKQFEHFVKWFLQNDPEWSTQVDQIWLWEEYPGRWGVDCGIDLVFRHKNGESWAVQAKCYAQQHDITKHDVDKFLSESNRKGIDKRLLIATTDRIGANAKQVCEAQEKSVFRYLLSNFESANLEYPATHAELYKAKRKPKPAPRDHQLEAIHLVSKGFHGIDRGQLIMACGTGKTFTTLWIKETLNATSTLILLPSLGLLSQTLHEWTLAANTPFDVLCVCSDDTVGKKGSDETIHAVADVAFPVTSNVAEIRRFLSRDGAKVVFSTYQSSPLVAEAQSEANVPDFDLAIADEAHRCAGKVGNDFTTVLDAQRIRASKRLFATATPRTYSTNVKKAAGERGIDVVGMDDETVFGTVLYSLPFGEAIKRGLLTDYQVVIIGVDDPTIAAWIEKRELVKTESGIETDTESLAAQIGLLKAFRDYDLRRVISFHSRVKRAEQFAKDILNVVDWIDKEHKPVGAIRTDFVSGEMATDMRRIKLSQLKSLAPQERGLLTNARCLSEGVDVPSLDGVAFIDPRSSQIDIIQAVGRAIRLNANKTAGTIILPVFIEAGMDAVSCIEASNFKPIWEVLNALKAHDDVLADELDHIRTEMGRKGKSNVAPNTLSKIHLDIPAWIDPSFGISLRTYLVEKVTESWDFWYGLLEDYIDHTGSSRAPHQYTTSNGFKLGAWLSNQRTMCKAGKLSQIRQDKLSSLPNWSWQQQDDDWNDAFSSLKRYTLENLDSRVPVNFVSQDGVALGTWVSNQKNGFRTNKLSPERIKLLESQNGWTWNTIDRLWDVGFTRLQTYATLHGDCNVPTAYKSENGFTLGKWVAHKRTAVRKGQLTDEQRTQLDTLPNWTNDAVETKWEFGFAMLQKYVETIGHANPPLRYRSSSGFFLGQWVATQREAKRDKKVSEGRANRLESLNGWTWDALSDNWSAMYGELLDYVKREGHASVPLRTRLSSGSSLGKWVQDNRIRYREGKLSNERVALLQALTGWIWDPYAESFNQGIARLIEYKCNYQSVEVPQRYKCDDGFPLGSWVSNKRMAYKRRRLPEGQVSAFDSIEGWLWNTKNDR